MGVSISKPGKVNIEISGDTTKLRRNLSEAERAAKHSSKRISETLSGAFDSKHVAKYATDLVKHLGTIRRSVNAVSSDVSALDSNFRNVGQSIDIAEKALGRFVGTQRRMFAVQLQKEFIGNLKEVQSATGASDVAINKMAKSIAEMSKNVDKLSGNNLSFGVSLGRGLKTAATVALIKIATEQLWEFGKASFAAANQNENLGASVSYLGKLAGYSPTQLDASINALRGMGAAGSEANAAIKELLRYQIDLSKAPVLFSIARDAMVLGGVSHSEAFEALVHAIQSGQSQMLQSIGIAVDFGNAYQNLANQLGKTTLELTAVEKQQVRVNEVVEAGKKISGAYEAAMPPFEKDMSRVGQAHQDLLTDVGKPLRKMVDDSGIIPFYISMVEGFNVKILADRHLRNGGQFKDLVEGWRQEGLQGVRKAQEGFVALKKELVEYEKELMVMAEKGIDVSPYRKRLEVLKNNFFGVRKEIASTTSALSYQNFTESLDDETEKTVDEMNATLQARIAELQKIQLSIASALAQLRELQEETKRNNSDVENPLSSLKGNAPEGSGVGFGTSSMTDYNKTALSSNSLNARANAIQSVDTVLSKLLLTEKQYAEQGISQQLKRKELEEHTRFLDGLEAQYQQTLKGTEAQIASIVTEMNRLRESAETARDAGLIPSDEEYDEIRAKIEAIEKRKTRDVSRDFGDGAARAFDNYAEDATNAAKNIEGVINNSLTQMENALMSFANTGKLEFSSLVDSILADLMRLVIRQSILGPIANALGSALGGLFGGGTSSPFSYNTSSGSMMDATKTAFNHTGGIAGRDATFYRSLPSSIFAEAPRYHSGGIAGLLPNEIPTILERGELVVPEHISRGLAPLSSVRKAVDGAGGFGKVEVHIHDNRSNQTSPPEVRQSSTPDGGVRIDLILRDAMDNYIYGGRADNHFASTFGLKKSKMN